MQVKNKNDQMPSKERGVSDSLNNKLRKITTFFALLILLGMPLFVWDKYFDILKVKYRFYFISVLIMVAVVIITFYKWIRENISLNERRYFLSLKQKIRFRFTITDISVLAFTAVTFISTLQSEYIYESFWGNEGRYNGLFMTLLFCVSYFLISRFVEFKRWMIDCFFLVSLIVCIWGILNFFKLDPFYFKRELVQEDWNRFTSTIGNINTYTAFVALFMGGAAILFISADSWKHKVWYYFCMIVSFYAIIMGISDNAYLAIGALLGFVPFYAFRTASGCRRYLIMLASLLCIMLNIAWICEMWPNHVIEFSSIVKILAGMETLKLLVALVWTACIVWILLARNNKSTDNKILLWPRIMWLVVCIFGIIVLLYILYDANLGENTEKYSAYSQYLIFNDDWGTHRMYNWKLGLSLYKEFPFIHKLFGYGPETYGILTIYNHYEEMTSRYNEIFENIHNEYLQYMITIGPIGMIAYISVIVSSICMGIKNALSRPWVIACVFAIICYAVQATVNIAQAITTPVFWMLLSLMVAGCREERSSS